MRRSAGDGGWQKDFLNAAVACCSESVVNVESYRAWPWNPDMFQGVLRMTIWLRIQQFGYQEVAGCKTADSRRVEVNKLQ